MSKVNEEQNKIGQILIFCNEHNIEIVSYGLSPNPDGFSYELYGDACREDADALDEMLESLNSSEEKRLRKLIFG